MAAVLPIVPLLEVMTAVLPTALLQGVPARAAVIAEDLPAAAQVAQVAQVAVVVAEAAAVVEDSGRLNN